MTKLFLPTVMSTIFSSVLISIKNRHCVICRSSYILNSCTILILDIPPHIYFCLCALSLEPSTINYKVSIPMSWRLFVKSILSLRYNCLLNGCMFSNQLLIAVMTFSSANLCECARLRCIMLQIFLGDNWLINDIWSNVPTHTLCAESVLRKRPPEIPPLLYC